MMTLTEKQLANAYDLADDDHRTVLADVWDTLDSPVYRVVDEEGVNVAGGQIRRLGQGHWLYVDNTDGYEIMEEDAAVDLTAIPAAKHVPLGWGENGEVIEL